MIIASDSQLKSELVDQGGTLIAEFSGVGNLAGVRNLFDLGVSVTALYREGEGYYGIAKESTALHVAAWRGRHGVVKELIARGAPVNAKTGKAGPRSSSPSKLASIPTGPSFARPIPLPRCSKPARRLKESNCLPATTKSINCCGVSNPVSGEPSGPRPADPQYTSIFPVISTAL